MYLSMALKCLGVALLCRSTAVCSWSMVVLYCRRKSTLAVKDDLIASLPCIGAGTLVERPYLPDLRLAKKSPFIGL